MEQTMRWFGPNDEFGLAGIRQAGCTGVVTALHHIPVGETWTIDEIETRQRIVDDHSLTWTVVESLPVHEDIKTRSGDWRLYIENYKQSIRNLARCGLKVITYNFMPVLDWVRTDIAFPMGDGSEALRFEKSAFIAFDLFELKRPDSHTDYTAAEIEGAKNRYDKMTADERENLRSTVLLGLPGSDEPFTVNQLQTLLHNYAHIDEAALRSNLFEFIADVSTDASAAGVQLAIHPDDPPWPVLGLPRVMSTAEDVRALFRAVPAASNGLCFCTGSFGARGDNDLLGMLEEFGERVHFLHLRNTVRDDAGNFFEADHLAGDSDMRSIVAAIIQLMEHTGRSIPMRPDHGHRMLHDLTRKSYPGYSGIGRMKALAELRGLELGLRR